MIIIAIACAVLSGICVGLTLWAYQIITDLVAIAQRLQAATAESEARARHDVKVLFGRLERVEAAIGDHVANLDPHEPAAPVKKAAPRKAAARKKA